ncbi:stage V sporulation protein AC [Anaerocolumna jejuensis DSM 15929]|uniref:Stage V sporulation protein AC n=1 Tax=Anaerocolumna jejuensis DSM 15929 TaxID=1121322 RepID=A0A1M6Y6M0_9FIRM|nr:SpoVA/SpoVAEb family sporulation membrane protein [Anaerocolumna jejuensis]SHL13924.1 stage V sporulation protein AC [Anaerocolumna jejuensis DSM 15929]
MDNNKKKVSAADVVNEQDKTKKAEKYNQYVKEKTPTHNKVINFFNAFWVGGAICIIGQALNNYYTYLGCNKDQAGGYTSLSLILLSVVLTGLNIYPKLAKFGGAGTVVPITGFANSVAAPAVEFKKEGQVFGIGCKIFTIAGPVILYGVFSSWVLGVIYYILMKMGVVG